MTPVAAPRRGCALAISALLLTAPAAPSLAGDFLDRGAVYATAGLNHVMDDEGSLGNGGLFGGAVQLRGGDSRLGIELAVDRFEHENRFSSDVVFRGDGELFSAAAVYHFPKGRTPGFLMVGAGVLRSSFESRSPLFDDDLQLVGQEVFKTRRSHGAFLAGAGFDGRIGKTLSLRPMVRYVAGGDISRFEALVGLGFHW